jgi:hypothetical protein
MLNGTDILNKAQDINSLRILMKMSSYICSYYTLANSISAIKPGRNKWATCVERMRCKTYAALQ